MKRLNNLYPSICNLDNILKIYDTVCKNIKNKQKLEFLRENRCIIASHIYDILESRTYKVGPSNTFYVYEPKKRKIASLNLQDKIVNHLVSYFIILPATLPCLIDANVASRTNLGTKRGLELSHKFHTVCKLNYGHYYILKCDINKFFHNINHSILKRKLETRIKDRDALNILSTIIDSNSEGLSIGTMSSQTLAVFYLNDFDHFVKETLKIKYYVRYQDDFLLFHPSKDYLKYCLKQIELFLNKEGLTLNKKTRIYKDTNNFVFLGRNRYGKYARYRTIKRKLKMRKYLYEHKKISLASYASSILTYKNLLKN